MTTINDLAYRHNISLLRLLLVRVGNFGHSIQMAWWEEKFQDAIGAITRGVGITKLGPGILGTIIPINTVGILAIAAIVYALSANPLFALIGGGFGFAFLVYANERAFRYAEKNPIPALLSGSEIFQLVRDQSSARDKSIIVEATPVSGASTSSIEGISDGA